MFRSVSAAIAFLLCFAATAKDEFRGVGRAATAAEIAAWDIDVRPDLRGLPVGSGSVREGEEIWEGKCASCHGSFGESNAVFPPIAGGTAPADIVRGQVAALAKAGEQRTTLMKLSQVSTLWDYINRAMPWNAPKTLSANEVYALTAFILNLGRIVPDNFVLSERNMQEVQKRLPNRNGMVQVPDLWNTRGKGDTGNTACMKDCGPEPRLLSSLPEHARGAHGTLGEQNRLVGPVRGIGTQPVASPGDPSKALAEKSGCLGCHGAKARGIGPSLAEIAARYRADNGAEPRLAAKVKSGGQGAWGSVPMPPQPQLADADVRTLIRWILTSE